MSDLALCAACARHVRVNESACPFCGTTRTPSAASPARVTNGARLSRAALASLALAGVTTLAACGKSNVPEGTPPDPPKPDNTMQAVPAYGGPPPEVPTAPTTATTDAGAKPTPNMQNVPAPAYGGPPPMKK